MVFVIICVLLAAFVLGWLSFYFNNGFAGLVSAPPAMVGVGSSFADDEYDLDHDSGFNLFDVLSLLPDTVQMILLTAPFVFIGGRLSHWAYKTYFYTEKPEEGRDAKRQRVLAEHGMDSRF